MLTPKHSFPPLLLSTFLPSLPTFVQSLSLYHWWTSPLTTFSNTTVLPSTTWKVWVFEWHVHDVFYHASKFFKNNKKGHTIFYVGHVFGCIRVQHRHFVKYKVFVLPRCCPSLQQNWVALNALELHSWQNEVKLKLH